MSIYAMVFILVYAIIVSFCTFLAVAWYLRLKRQEYLKEIIHSLFPQIDPSIFNEETGADIESQIDLRLEEIVLGFKKQIPMISLFLSKTKEAELKATAKFELMKLIPVIKQRFMQKAVEYSSLNQNNPLETQLRLHLRQLLDRLWKQVKCRIFGIALAVGCFLGLLEVAFLLWIPF